MEQDILSVIELAVADRIETADSYRQSDDLSDIKKVAGIG